MATFVPPKRGVALTFYVGLISRASRPQLQAAPTLAAGDVQVSKDGGAFANLATLPVVTPAAGRAVKVDLSAIEMTADQVVVQFVDAAGAEWDDLLVNIQTAARQIDDLAFPNVSGRGVDVDATGGVEITANQAVNAAQWAGAATATDDVALATAPANFAAFSLTAGGLVTLAGVTHTGAVIPTITTLTGHTAQTGDNFARLGAPVGVSVSADIAAVQADTDNIQTRLPGALVAGRIDASVGAMAAGVVTAAAIATGAIDADAIALDAADEILGSVSGTADSGSTTTVVDAERTEADTDYWKGSLIVFTSGTLSGQARLVTAFNAATDTLTFAPALTVAAGTHTYRLIPQARVDLHLWVGVAANALIAGRPDVNAQVIGTGAIVAGSFAAGAIDNAAFNVTETLTANPAAGGITAASFGAGAIDNAAFNVTETLTANPAAGGIVAASFGTGAIDAAALAVDAGTEIAAAVWDRDATLSQTQGTFGQAIGDPVADTNTIYKGIVTDATGATVGVDAAAILADTGTDGVVVASINANAVSAAVIATGAIDADAIAADAANEIRDAVWAQAMTEPTAVPSVTGTLKVALEWLLALGRNKVTQTATTQTLRNDADSANIATSTLSDDATTFTRGEWL